MHWISKLNFLVIGLALTIYAIYAVQHRGLNPQLASVMGVTPAKTIGVNHLNSSTAATDGHLARVAKFEANSNLRSESRLNWCETRVTGLIRPEKLKLTQVAGHSWVLEGGATQRKVDFIAVEKWLNHHCSVAANGFNAKPTATSSLEPMLLVKFVNGKVGVLRGDQNGHFEWNDLTFTSAELLGALAELEHLPDSARK